MTLGPNPAMDYVSRAQTCGPAGQKSIIALVHGPNWVHMARLAHCGLDWPLHAGIGGLALLPPSSTCWDWSLWTSHCLSWPGMLESGPCAALHFWTYGTGLWLTGLLTNPWGGLQAGWLGTGGQIWPVGQKLSSFGLLKWTPGSMLSFTNVVSGALHRCTAIDILYCNYSLQSCKNRCHLEKCG